MSSFLLEIVTPERVAFRDQVAMVTAPSPDGYITVLPGHTTLFTRLSEGEVKIVRGDEDLYLAIGSGFLEVRNNTVQVLVTSALHADEINEEEIRKAQERAKKILSQKPEGMSLLEAQSLFHRSTIALNVVRKRKRRM